MKYIFLIQVFLLCLILEIDSFSHGGRLDKNCGHRDTKNDSYHKHPERCKNESVTGNKSSSSSSKASRPSYNNDPKTKSYNQSPRSNKVDKLTMQGGRLSEKTKKWGLEYEVLVIKSEKTISILRDGTTTTLRLSGIDYGSYPDPDHIQNAKKYLSDTLLGKTIYIREDRKADIFGIGLPVYVYRAEDELFINRDMIMNGISKAIIKKDYDLKGSFLHYQHKAKQKKIGIWDL